MKPSKPTKGSRAKGHASERKLDLYADTNVWSQRYKLWRKYHVKKPRLPNQTDKEVRWVDAPINKPLTINSMYGNHNDEILLALRNIREQFEEAKVLPPSMIIYGPSGSGKTTIAQKLAAEFVKDLVLSPVQATKFVLEVDIGNVNNFNGLWSKLTKFAEPVIERFNPTSFRVVIVDNADLIPPSQQQLLKRLMEVFEKKTRWLFICCDAKKMITHVQTQSIILKTRNISEKDAVTVLLNMCYKNKIGYNREGIHAVLTLFQAQISLSKMIDFMQKTFIEKSYISEENVAIMGGSDYPKPVLPVTAAVQPVARCRICTLLPPCQHTSEAELCEISRDIRARLPRNRSAMACSEFIRFGHCTAFNRHGKCSFDHPKDVHEIKEPIHRCGRCTIPWPCHHCDYSASRDRLIHTIADLQDRLHLLKQLVVPDPLINIAGYLNELYPLWKGVMLGFGATYLDPVKAELIQGVLTWVDTSFSMSKEEYKVKERLLRFAFGELLSSPLLNREGLKRAYDGEEENEEDDELSHAFPDRPSSPISP